jgi:chromosome partitioning protein
MAYLISVANQKGGVAKTTTVVSLGAALVHQGAQVLVIDLDPQANLTMSLGVEPSSVHQSIANILLNQNPMLSAIRSTSVQGLDLIPSNTEMELAERFLPIRKNYKYILREATNSLPEYNYLIFDCPPSLGAVTTNALQASHLLITPTQAEYFSISALRSMLKFIQRERDQGNPNLIYRILLTMYDQRNRIHRTLRDQLQVTFYEGLFQQIIGIDTKLRESSVVGLPITDYNPKTRSAIQYTALAQELKQHVQEYVVRFV